MLFVQLLLNCYFIIILLSLSIEWFKYYQNNAYVIIWLIEYQIIVFDFIPKYYLWLYEC